MSARRCTAPISGPTTEAGKLVLKSGKPSQAARGPGRRRPHRPDRGHRGRRLDPARFSRRRGGSGYFQHRFAVYDREGEPCPTPGCTGTIKRIVQSGRSTFFCPVCQKPDGVGA